jgi:hypothetical protein
MIVLGHSELARSLCLALGIDPTDVVRLDLHLAVQEPMTATVTKFVHDNEAQKIISVLEIYNFAVDDDDDAHV